MVIQQALGTFQLSYTLTQQIMNRIRHLSPSSTPTGKPILPWLATTVTLIALLVGVGPWQTARFQPTISLSILESATMVEIIDAPVLDFPALKTQYAHQTGHLLGKSADSGHQTENSSVRGVQAVQETDKAVEKGTWTSMNGPYGGDVLSLQMTPNGTLFASAGYGKLFRSLDKGESWTEIHNPLKTARYAGTIRVLAFIDNTLYAVGRKVFRSTDGGQSWEQDARFGEDSDRYLGIAIDGEIRYVGSHQGGVLQSKDEGLTWTDFNEGLPADYIGTFTAVSDILFVGTKSGLFRRKLGEKSWQPVYKKRFHRDPQKVFEPFKGVTSLQTHDNTLYLATNRHLYRSSNSGDSWIEIPTKSSAILPISAFVGDGKTLYMGIADRGVFRSADEGKSWHAVNKGLTVADVEKVAVSDGILYAASYFDISRSTDDGRTWTAIANGLPDSYHTISDLVVLDGTLYAAVNSHEGNIYRFFETSNNWIPISTDERLMSVTCLMVHGKTFYAGTDGDGVFTSHDRGETWDNLGLANKWVNTLIVKGKAIYAGTEGDGVFRSKMGSRSWTSLEVSGQMQRAKTLTVIDDTVYAAGTNEASFIVGGFLKSPTMVVYRSNDDGASWKLINAGLQPYVGVSALTTDGKTLYAVTMYQAYHLPAGSNSWQEIGQSLWESIGGRSVPLINSLAVDGSSLYTGTHGFGVLRLTLCLSTSISPE